MQRVRVKYSVQQRARAERVVLTRAICCTVDPKRADLLAETV